MKINHPKDHWTIKTAYFEDPNPAIQVQTLLLEGPRSLGHENIQAYSGIYMAKPCHSMDITIVLVSGVVLTPFCC